MTRHHLVPRRDPRYKDHLDMCRQRRIIDLCRRCHKKVHKAFGEGHNFKGPITRKHLLKWLRIKNNLTQGPTRVS